MAQNEEDNYKIQSLLSRIPMLKYETNFIATNEGFDDLTFKLLTIFNNFLCNDTSLLNHDQTQKLAKFRKIIFKHEGQAVLILKHK